MRNKIYLTICGFLCVVALSCQREASDTSLVAQASKPIPSEFGAPEFIRETGIYAIILGDNDWRALDNNYRFTIEKHAGHRYLENYKEMATNHLIVYAKMLDDESLSAETLLFYLQELDKLKYSYPMINYLMIDKMRQLDESIVDSDGFSQLIHNAYKKGLKDEGRRKENSERGDEIARENYRLNYEVFLPKLAALSTELSTGVN